MNREGQSLILLLLGGVVLRISVTDTYLRYVKAGLRPYLIISGVLLIVVAVVTLWRDLAQRRLSHSHDQARGGKHRAGQLSAEPACCDAPNTEAGHRVPHGQRTAWLLGLPVLAILLAAPPSLGSYAASRTGTALSAAATPQQKSGSASMYPALPPGDPVQVTVLDYAARAVFEEGVSLRGRRVTLMGFATPNPDGGVYLTRMLMVCCAADARPLKVGLSGDFRMPRHDQWFTAVGVYDAKTDIDPVNDEKIPYLRVSSLKLVDPPDNPYDTG